MRNWALLCAFLLVLPARSGGAAPKKITLDTHGVDVVEVVDWALNTLTKKYPSQRLIQIVSASRSDIAAPPGATYFLTLELNRRGHIEVIVSVIVVVAVGSGGGGGGGGGGARVCVGSQVGGGWIWGW
jgi:hypothetical protein